MHPEEIAKGRDLSLLAERAIGDLIRGDQLPADVVAVVLHMRGGLVLWVLELDVK